MMKKTICFLFVFALIAQICARPDDKDDKTKDDAAKKAKEAADKGKDDVDKAKGDAGKAAKDAKDKVVKEEKKHVDDDDDDDDDDDKKATAEKAKAEAKAKAAALAAAGHKKSTHGKHHKMGDMVRDTAAVGEEIIKTGSDMWAGMMDKLF